MQIPGAIFRDVTKALKPDSHAALRLTCTTWRDHLRAKTLSHTLQLPASGHYESRISSLHAICPKIKVEVACNGPVSQLCKLLDDPLVDSVSYTFRLPARSEYTEELHRWQAPNSWWM